eukprot:564654-Pyramimonas_sp.AAC.1
MRASIHAHFIEQCRNPKKFDFVCQIYDLSRDKLGQGVKTYEWLMEQIEAMMLRDKEEWNISVHESTLNHRARQTRLGGGGSNCYDNRRNANGKAAPAEVAARLGEPMDVMKSGLTKGGATCKFVRKGQACPNAGQGCPFNHKKPKAAAPAQPAAGG